MELVVGVLLAALAASAAVADEELGVPRADPVAASELDVVDHLDEGAPLRARIHDVELVRALLIGDVEMGARRDGLIHRQVRNERPPRRGPAELAHIAELRAVRGDDDGRQLLLGARGRQLDHIYYMYVYIYIYTHISAYISL